MINIFITLCAVVIWFLFCFTLSLLNENLQNLFIIGILIFIIMLCIKMTN